MYEQKRWKLIVCFCRGLHHSLEKFDLWKYTNAVTQFPEIEGVTIVPMICKTNIPNAIQEGLDDGKSFLKNFIKDGETYILGACDRDTQRKRIKESCTELGIDFEKTFYSVDLRYIDAEEGIRRTRKLLDELVVKSA